MWHVTMPPKVSPWNLSSRNADAIAASIASLSIGRSRFRSISTSVCGP